MLICKDVVIVKNEKGELQKSETYDRIYLSYGPNDPVEESIVSVGGTPVGKRTKPKGEKSVHPVSELLAEAIKKIQTERPKSDPTIVMLEQAEYGLDLQRRAAVRQTLVPSKPIDEDKALESMAKKIVALGYQPDIASAIAFLRTAKTGTASAASSDATNVPLSQSTMRDDGSIVPNVPTNAAAKKGKK